jgi:mono/diheme cytochrome c family protein
MRTGIFVSATAFGIAVTATAALSQSTSEVSDQLSRSGFVLENGLQIPAFDPVKGRALFGEKGCVVCHSINGVGGEDAPDLSAEHMERPMNAFEFAARMWRGAPAMIAMQEDELGGQIELTGDELAAIIAFVHDSNEQGKFSEADVPEEIMEILEGDHDEETDGG